MLCNCITRLCLVISAHVFETIFQAVVFPAEDAHSSYIYNYPAPGVANVWIKPESHGEK